MSSYNCGDCLYFFDCWDAGDCTEDHKPCKDFHERDDELWKEPN